MSITSLSLTFVSMYAPQSAKPAAAAQRPVPAAPAESKCCDEQRAAPRQNRLVQAMMSALRELGLGPQSAPAPAAAASTESPVPAASAQPAPAEAVATNASSAAESVVETPAQSDASPAATQAQAASEPAAAIESAVHQFAHELFRALRQIGRGDASEERSGRIEGEDGRRRHHGHHHHHGHHGWRREGYGDMSQRLEALSQTFAAQSPAAVADNAPAAAVSSSISITLTVQDGQADAPAQALTTAAPPAASVAAEAPATTGTVQSGAKNPLLEAFSKLFNALKLQSPATAEADMGDKLRLFLQSLAQAIRPEAMSSIQTPQVGGLVNVTA